MMEEMSFYEFEAFDACIQEALAQLGAPEVAGAKLKGRIDDDDYYALSSAIVELCKGGLHGAEVESTLQPAPPTGGVGANHMRLWSERSKDGRPQAMLFIRVRDILPNLGIQLLALGIAIGAHSPSGITNALSAFKTLYENSIKLKSPEDDDAMLVYEALLRHAVTIISGDDTSSTTAFKKPNAADLERFGGPSPKEAVKALLKLREVKLVDIQAWGNDIGDINHPDNRWELRA